MVTHNIAVSSSNRPPLIFGEVLFDCFPDGRQVLGGAPFNVAWNLQAFGLQPLLVSRVGDDTLGKRIQAKMASWNMSTAYLQTDSRYPTGMVQIELAGGEPLFSIMPDQAYDHIAPVTESLQNEPGFLYHGSLAVRHDQSRLALSALKKQYHCPIFVDVNLRSPWWNGELVKTLVGDATWLKLNENELDALFPGNENMEQRCSLVLERFDLQCVFVTLGDKGALALDRANNLARTKPRKNLSIVDTVGAGDAFSSVLLLGLMKDWPLDITMQRAQEFSSEVVSIRGAITDVGNFYQIFADSWDLS